MKAGKGLRKTLYSILCSVALLAGFLVPGTVKASSLPQTGSIALSYELENVEFRLHKVGMVDSEKKLVLTGEYANYGIDAEADNVAQTLETYIDRDEIAPLMTVLTDADGDAKFENLEYAVYLVCGAKSEMNHKKYTPVPVLVYLPTENNGATFTDVGITIKFEVETLLTKVNLSLLKVWDDAGKESARPRQITIELLKNGAVYKSVTLNAQNNWKYQWKDLDGSATWTVAEKTVPDGYEVAIQKSGSSFVVTNTRIESKETSETLTPPTTKPGELPRTGQLWWPVFVLVFGGLLLVIIGLIFKRTECE